MSIRKQLKTLISEKLKTRSDRLSETTNLEDQVNIVGDYRLYFSGGLEALRAAGISAEDITPFVLASETNDAELKLLEHRLDLESELGSDE